MPIEVLANIASRDDALEAVRHGADGVGLLRTEFLFLDRPQPPGEDEQLEAYLSIADALGGRRLTVRTLDIGGDKPVPYLPAANEANPFLGRRGLRLSLQQPDMFKQQLRALVRAGMQHPITVLFPMVTTIDELRAALALLAEAAAEVGCSARRSASWFRSRRHGRGAGLRTPRPGRRSARRPHQHRHQRLDPVHARRRTRQRRRCRARRFARPRGPAPHLQRHQRSNRDGPESRYAASWPATRLPLRFSSVSASASSA